MFCRRVGLHFAHQLDNLSTHVVFFLWRRSAGRGGGGERRRLRGQYVGGVDEVEVACILRTNRNGGGDLVFSAVALGVV